MWVLIGSECRNHTNIQIYVASKNIPWYKKVSIAKIQESYLLLLLLLKMETALSLGNILGQTVPKVDPKAPEAEDVEGPGLSSLSSLK